MVKKSSGPLLSFVHLTLTTQLSSLKKLWISMSKGTCVYKCHVHMVAVCLARRKSAEKSSEKHVAYMLK